MAAINGFDKALKVDGIKKKASYLAKCEIGNYAKTFAHKKKTVPLELRRIGGDASSVRNSFLRHHFAGKLLVVWQNVGCFFRLKGKCCACV